MTNKFTIHNKENSKKLASFGSKIDAMKYFKKNLCNVNYSVLFLKKDNVTIEKMIICHNFGIWAWKLNQHHLKS